MHLKIVTEKIENGYLVECTLGVRKVTFGPSADECAAAIAAAAAEWAEGENAERARRTEAARD